MSSKGGLFTDNKSSHHGKPKRDLPVDDNVSESGQPSNPAKIARVVSPVKLEEDSETKPAAVKEEHKPQEPVALVPVKIEEGLPEVKTEPDPNPVPPAAEEEGAQQVLVPVKIEEGLPEVKTEPDEDTSNIDRPVPAPMEVPQVKTAPEDRSRNLTQMGIDSSKPQQRMTAPLQRVRRESVPSEKTSIDAKMDDRKRRPDPPSGQLSKKLRFESTISPTAMTGSKDPPAPLAGSAIGAVESNIADKAEGKQQLDPTNSQEVKRARRESAQPPAESTGDTDMSAALPASTHKTARPGSNKDIQVAPSKAKATLVPRYQGNLLRLAYARTEAGKSQKHLYGPTSSFRDPNKNNSNHKYNRLAVILNGKDICIPLNIRGRCWSDCKQYHGRLTKEEEDELARIGKFERELELERELWKEHLQRKRGDRTCTGWTNFARRREGERAANKQRRRRTIPK